MLGDLGRYSDALGVFDEVVARCAGASESPLVGRLAWALGAKGWSLAKLKRWDEAIAVYDELLVRFSDSSSPYVQERVLEALVNKMRAVFQAERYDEARVVCDVVADRLDTASDSPQLRWLADALLTKAKIQASQERFEEAIATLDAIVERFHDADRELRMCAVMALNNKTAALNRLGRIEEAIATNQRLIDEFGDEAIATFDVWIVQSIDAVDSLGRENLAGALAGKATALTELNRRDEAIATFTQLVDLFSDEEDPTIAHVVATAREALDQLSE